MPKFSQTESALADLPSNLFDSRGRHTSFEVKTGASGIKIGELEYDPNKHTPIDIDPMSTMSMITGMPYVRQVIPNRPIEANVILHNSKAGSRSDIFEIKSKLASTLIGEISRAMPAIRDRVNCYVIGDDLELSQELLRLGANAIKGTEDPVVAATKTADLCMNGLAFILSDFERLPLEDVDHVFSRTVGIKVNHKYDINIDDLRGRKAVLGVGGSREIRLWKDRDVDSFNEGLEVHDEAIVERLKRIGISVARVISDQNEINGFSIKGADSQIARAINRL